MQIQIFWIYMMSALVIGITSFTVLEVAAQNSLDIFPPGDKPYGLSYSDHLNNFWRYLLAIPAKDNPFNDQTGEKCAIGQENLNSSVFYLAPNGGGPSERTCKVPIGKGLMLQVMHVEASGFESPGASDQELSEIAKADQDTTVSLYLKIDDKEYTMNDLTRYRTHTEPFETTWPDKALFGIDKGGNTTVVADGFPIITKPLEKGNHTIHMKSSLAPDPSGAPGYATDIIYNIIADDKP